MPKVSIVMPTRNRAHLLKTALKSALLQTYEDLEIIVSDNYSTEDTKKVVESFSSPKIRYVRTAKALDMPESWNFALSNARGEYITYLTDDSYLLSDAIEKTLSILNNFGKKVIAWHLCEYLSHEWSDKRLRNSMLIPRFNSQPYVVESVESLEKVVDQGIWYGIPTPKFLNSMCHRQIVEKAISTQKKMFLPPCPDYSCVVAILKHVENYVVMERPMAIGGVFKESIGASQTFDLGPASKKFLEEFEDKSFIKILEPNLPTVSMLVAQTFEITRKCYKDLPQLNKKSLIDGSISSLVLLENNKVNVNEAWRILDEYLLKESEEFRNNANKLRKYLRTKLKLKSKIEKFIPMLFLEHLNRWRNGSIRYWGKNSGFLNLEECGKIALQ